MEKDAIRVVIADDEPISRMDLKECGIIYVSDGTPRIAYEFIRISE